MIKTYQSAVRADSKTCFGDIFMDLWMQQFVWTTSTHEERILFDTVDVSTVSTRQAP